jgi:hypothetical protein
MLSSLIRHGQINRLNGRKGFILQFLSPKKWKVIRFMIKNTFLTHFSYEILELHQLKKQLPINRLIHQHGLLCMWVSNSERIRHFVCDLIENQWSMTVVATWFWLKVFQ